MALSEKHREVALAYIADAHKIGWRAYQKIYPGATQHAAETAWSRLMKNAEFSACVAELAKAAAAEKVMSAQDVLEELSKIGRADLRNYGRLGMSDDIREDLAALPAEHTAALAEITVETYSVAGDVDEKREKQPHGGALKRSAKRQVRRIRFKLHSKPAALDLLGKHHKLYVERHEHDFTGVAARLAAAIARTSDRRQDDKIRSPGDPARARRARKAKGKGKRARPRRGRVREDADLPRGQ